MASIIPPPAFLSLLCREWRDDTAFRLFEPDPTNDYDSPWKEALELYFEPAMALLMPALHALVDWSQPVSFLDKEFQALSHQLPSGRQVVDKLAKVHGLNHKPMFILVHIEVQGDAAQYVRLQRMAERMTFYMFRIRDRWRKDFADERIALFSLAILTNSSSGSSMLQQTWDFLGCSTIFQCPVVHLGQWWKQWEKLELIARSNPFAVVIMAQLLAHRFQGEARLVPKTQLMRMLHQYGYTQDAVRSVFRLIDWMLLLPADQEPAFFQAMQAIEQERHMPFVTSIERHLIALNKAEWVAEGKAEGKIELLQNLLSCKFGTLPAWVEPRLQQADANTLTLLSERILSANSLEDAFDVKH